MKKDNLIAEKTKNFAIQIIHLYLYLSNERKEYVLSKQVLRSGTSIGANVKEATQAQSKADFISKMSIALKETSFLNEKQFNEINKKKRIYYKDYYENNQNIKNYSYQKLIINHPSSIINHQLIKCSTFLMSVFNTVAASSSRK